MSHSEMEFSLKDAKTIREAIGITLGYASICWYWENEERVLDTDKLVKATDELERYFLMVLSESH